MTKLLDVTESVAGEENRNGKKEDRTDVWKCTNATRQTDAKYHNGACPNTKQEQEEQEQHWLPDVLFHKCGVGNTTRFQRFHSTLIHRWYKEDTSKKGYGDRAKDVTQ